MARQVVIGLEIHLQLNTKTKLFCECSTDYIGAQPNSNVCPLCLAVPGTLPIINDHAVELAVKMGLGLHCQINDQTRFHRKHYFYADLPKAYQITQYEHAIATGGYLDIVVDGHTKRVRLDHLHLEEDAGKLVHPTSDGRLSGASYSLVDYNRGGIPLSEIVSMPDMNSAAEAIAYITQIRQLARYLKVSDGEMESGSLRVDVNVSLSNPDGSFGTRVEIKNVNSLKSVERALEYEIARQNRALDTGEPLYMETRLWDDVAGVTRSMRNKESARDYRYYLEMDLAPIDAKPEYVEHIRSHLPEMPWDKRDRFVAQYGLSFEDSVKITEQLEMADYFEKCVAQGAPADKAFNWIMTEVARVLNDKGTDISDFKLPACEVGKLLVKIAAKELSNTQAKDVFAVMVEKTCTVEEAIKQSGVSTGKLQGDALTAVVQKIIDSQPEVADTIRSGEDKKGGKMKFLQGLVMRETRGAANPAEVEQLIQTLLK